MRDPFSSREHYALPQLGAVRLDELKTRHLRDLRATLGTQRPSPKTVKNIIGSSLRALVRDATSDELLTTDPFVGLKWERTIRKKPYPFTASERDKILGWFATKRRWYYPFVFTLPHRHAPLGGRRVAAGIGGVTPFGVPS